MSVTPDDDPTIVPIRSIEGGGSGASGQRATGRSAGNALPMGTRLGEFEITGIVGEGGFGIVYLAHDHVLGRNVALKEYMPSSLAARTEAATVIVRSARYEEPFQAGLRSFINEARLLARFDHPSLVKVYRFWDANGTAYMAMPFYEGVTLKALLKSHKSPPDEVWLKDLLRPVTEALDLLHADHCFHRDIAPDNILMLDGKQPLLLDFGAARRVIGDLTHELTAILKPGYAPVEQYAEAASMKQGAWTDIYALASVVYYAIMGKPPEPSVARLIADPMVPLSVAAAGRYSAQFLRGIDKALSVRPQERQQSVAELRSLLGIGTPGTLAATIRAGMSTPRGDPITPRAGVTTPPSGTATASAASTVAASTVPMPVVGSDETTILRPSRVEQREAKVVVEKAAAPVAARRATWPIAVLAVALVVVLPAAYFFFAGSRETPHVVEQPKPVTTTPSPAPAQPERPAATAPSVTPTTPAQPPATTVTTTEPVAPPQPGTAKTAPSHGKSPATGASTTATKIDKAECTELLQRASLGETLTSAEQKKLREDCR
jgi:serine/threonine protein kinase